MKHTPLFALLSLLALLPLAHAELPPDAYADMQTRAAEHLTIEVIDVDTSICWLWLCSGRDIDVRARVVAVYRTATGLTAGDPIRIHYRHRMTAEAGPSPIRILTEGTTTPAWLAKSGDHYLPAAGGYSFSDEVMPQLAPAP